MAKNIESKHEKYLKRCIELATESLEAGDAPFGSILVDKEGKIIAEGRNRANELNVLAHPEVEMARWAADNLSPEEWRALHHVLRSSRIGGNWNIGLSKFGRTAF